MDLVSQLRGIRPGEDSVRADGGEVERHGERHGSSIFTYHEPRPPTPSSTRKTGATWWRKYSAVRFRSCER